jgi:predicted secreted Zn-dependent protease
MRMRVVLLLFGALCLCGAIAPAAAELLYSTAYHQHNVYGATPHELWQYMNAHPIIDPDDGPAYANLTHDHDLKLTVATSNGACRVTDLTFRWNFVLTLPVAADYDRMSAATRSMWDGFVAALKRHEESHRAIFVDCGNAFVPAATRLTGPAGCFGMERKVRRFIDQRYEACMAEQKAFEGRDRPHIVGLPFIRAATGK